jgi:hypothetical protein
MLDGLRKSPLVGAADQMAGLLEGVASDLASKAENVATSATSILDNLVGRNDAGYDACHSACHPTRVWPEELSPHCPSFPRA